MSGFYNPYSKNPDWGQGISDIINQITQIMMLKKAYPGASKDGAAQNNTTMPTQQQMGIVNGPIGQNKQAADLFGDPRLLAALMKLIGGGGQY